MCMKRVFSICLSTALVMVTLATVAHGAILIEEGFNYEQTSWDWDGDYVSPVTETGLDGGTGFAGGSEWGVGLKSGTTTGTVGIVDGITFGDLQTSGNALFTQNLADSAMASRAIDVTVATGTTVWTSYLWRFSEKGNISATAASQLVDSSDQFGSTGKRLRIIPKAWGTRVKSSMSEGHYYIDATIPLLQDGDTYLMVAKNGNIGQTGSNTLWVMAEAGFDICAADEIVTEAELDANCVGTVTGNLLSNTITSGAYLQLLNWWGAGTFDEFRMGATLEDVTPISATDVTPGDANEDGSVDVSDLGILATNYGTTTGMGWGQGDFNEDGAVDVSDLGVLATNYGTSTAATSAVPEPSVLMLLAGIVLPMIFIHRR